MQPQVNPNPLTLSSSQEPSFQAPPFPTQKAPPRTVHQYLPERRDPLVAAARELGALVRVEDYQIDLLVFCVCVDDGWVGGWVVNGGRFFFQFQGLQMKAPSSGVAGKTRPPRHPPSHPTITHHAVHVFSQLQQPPRVVIGVVDILLAVQRR